MCGHLWREMFVSKKNFYDLLFVFSSVFETPLFRLTNRRIASKLQTWWKKEDAGRGTLTNWYVFCTIESKILRPHLNFDTTILKGMLEKFQTARMKASYLWMFVIFPKGNFPPLKKSSNLFGFGLVEIFLFDFDLILYASVKVRIFAKSPPYFCLQYIQTKVRWRFAKFCGLLRIYEL